jgi:hypothetical protein
MSPWSDAVLGRASLADTQAADAAPAAPPLTRKRAFWRQEWFLFLLFVAPNFFFFAVFSYWPMISNVYLSMVRWDMISPVKTFVGGANFAYLFGNDTFRTVLKNSLVFTVGAVGGTLILGLAAALLLNPALAQRRAGSALRTNPPEWRRNRHRLGLHLRSPIWAHGADSQYGGHQFSKLAD